MLKLLEDFSTSVSKPVSFFQDKQGALSWETAGIRHTKHVATRIKFVLEHVSERVIVVRYCPSSDVVADVLTKPLLRTLHHRHCKSLRVSDHCPTGIE